MYVLTSNSVSRILKMKVNNFPGKTITDRNYALFIRLLESACNFQLYTCSHNEQDGRFSKRERKTVFSQSLLRVALIPDR